PRPPPPPSPPAPPLPQATTRSAPTRHPPSVLEGRSCRELDGQMTPLAASSPSHSLVECVGLVLANGAPGSPNSSTDPPSRTLGMPQSGRCHRRWHTARQPASAANVDASPSVGVQAVLHKARHSSPKGTAYIRLRRERIE